MSAPFSGPSRAEQVGAVLAAAGASTRMGGVDKLFQPVRGRPLLYYSLRALQACPQVDRIALVAAAGSVDRVRDLVEKLGQDEAVSVCAGGERRQDSVAAGLARLEGVEWVVVHDAARPCLSPRLVRSGLEAARETGAAVAAVPATDTIKLVDEQEMVQRTLPRERLRAVQCPQVFSAALLRRAHHEVRESVTDDAAMVEALGCPVRAFPGSLSNVKVTARADLAIVEALLALEERDR